MHRYIIKRMLFLIPIVLGVSLIIFSILYFIPGDPGSIILGPGALQDDIDKLNNELGYNLPFIERYLRYIYNAFFRFDLGISYSTKLPVFTEVMVRLPISILVAFNAICFAIVVGVPLGVLSAVKQYSLLDKIPTGLALFFASLPLFLIGMVLMLIFSLQLRWFPSTGIGSWKHYVLPMLSIGLHYAGQQFRFTRSSMLETIRQDYVRTARAKGATERTVIWRHAMKNALLPVITVAGNNFSVLIGGSVVIETLFGIPGLGVYIVNGVKQMDVPVVMGGITVFAVVFSVNMLLVDISYAFADPRIKAKYRK
ncbi:ABC transporter, permease protein [uncultured delta proteobacterium]|uniref:ABC transporter, permease protein n=1 Tax=uncultured delta proteobacterium TaxID=34034 RepID=A0A212JCQ7_9DELT|nr:ABC transporter, permease protein [uncultured delta proteobacterium]